MAKRKETIMDKSNYPIHLRRFVLAVALTLASPVMAGQYLRTIVAAKATPGESTRITALEGHKTVKVEYTGTATTYLYCKISPDQTTKETMLTLTGAAQNGAVEFDTACGELWIDVTSCSGCSVSGWIMNEGGQ